MTWPLTPTSFLLGSAEFLYPLYIVALPLIAFATPRFYMFYIFVKICWFEVQAVVIGPLPPPDNSLHFGQATIPGWSKFNSIVRSVKTPLLRSRTWQIKKQIQPQPQRLDMLGLFHKTLLMTRGSKTRKNAKLMSPIRTTSNYGNLRFCFIARCD